MEVGFRNYGEVMSPSYFAIVTWTHARVSYSFLGWMVIHFESVRLKKMSMTLENLVEMMSPTYFEIVAFFSQKTSKRFANSDSSSIECSRKGVYGV